jgi:hypothetical protein
MYMNEWRGAQARKKELSAKADQAFARKDAGLSHEDLTDEEDKELNELIKRTEQMSKGIPKDVQDSARKMAADAIVRGKEGAIRDIIDILPAGKGVRFQEGFKQELPENKAIEAAAEEAEEEANAQAHLAAQKRNAARKAQERESADMARVADQVSSQLEAQRQREARDAAQAAKQSQAETAKLEHDRPQQQAEQRVRQAAGFNGVSLTPQQITSAASQALASVAQGADVNQAILGALMDIMEHARQLKDRLQAQEAAAHGIKVSMNRLMSNTDTSGNFSLAPVIPMGTG